MVNDKYVVKYLDPRTGKYEYATVKDVGDLQKLNTKVKTSIVDAINSISTDGIDGLRNDLDTIGKTIKSLEDGTLELGDFQSIDDVVSREIEDAINSLKDENSGLLKLTQEEIDKIVSDAESEYRDSIAASVRELETSKSDLEDAREKMTSIGQMLENADINYSSLTQVVDDINLYITDVIEKTDFDMVNGIVSDYKTAVTQSKDGWGVDASKNMLSYLTGRVKNNETSLDVQHGLIQAKVGKDEFQYMTVDNLPAGKENMLHNTSDLRDWNFSSAFIFKSADDYRFTSIVQSDSAGENIIGTTDELEQGVTYAISAYVNVQNKNKKPNEEKYASTDGDYTATVIIDGETIELNNVVEDNSALDGWKRVSGTFIAKRTAQQDIKFYVTAFNRNTQVGYLSAPKLEKGSSATSWIPHIEDNVSTILSQNAVMRVLSDRITSSVEEVRDTKGAFETATSTFDQMADGFELNTNKLSEVLDKYGEVTGVQTQQASELKVLNESITSKVWKQDINTTLDTINIDTSNRIVNSAFNIYSYDEQTGELQLDYWDSNTGFEIKKHSQSLDNYLYAKRSNATSVNPISIKSSPFALRDGEKILFNFEYLAVGNPLDNDNVITLEMYDNDDVRVGLQEFKLSELKKEFLTAYDVGDSYKYNGTYIVKNSSVVKGTITLKLPKNGELWLTKIMLQNAGIGTIGWTPSSIDNQIIQSKLSTEINQLADSIELVAKDERLDAISGLLVKKDGKITISPESIVSRVTSQELGDNALITQTSLTQTEDNLRFDLVDKEGVIQTINASSEGLLIDFDKVHIDGEVIARMISAQAIDVTQGFRLTDNNGNTLLALVNDDGKPTLSITKEFRVKIGEVNDKLDVTIVGVVEEFYYSVDPDEPLGGRWTSTPNAFQGGDNRFIWKRTKIIYQSGDTSYYPNETGINITGSWEYEKESVTAEVVRALDSAEDAKELAVSESNQAMIDANKYADEQDALIRQQVTTSVADAISKADHARQVATDSYNNAVARAEELTEEQSEAFNKKFEENASEMDTLSQATQDADTKAQEALSKAGANANVLDTHQNTLNTINNTTIPNINISISDAMSEAKSAMDEAKAVDGKIDTFKTEVGNTISDVNTKAQQAIDDAGLVDGKIDTFKTEVTNTISTISDSAKLAMDEAQKADGKIADYVTKNGLVSGTTVDSKIDTATGEISKKITTVEGKIPAPEDIYTQEEFKIFESAYNEDVNGITSRLGTVENDISDSNTEFTTFKENDYKRTAERVSDTFTKQETTTMLGSKADASQLSNYLAKSTYERDAEQSTLRFETIETNKADTTYVNSEVKNSADEIKTTLNSYAKTTDLNGLATETYANNQAISEAGKVKNELTKYAKTTDLTGLASETYATNVAVSEAEKVSNELTKYAKTTALTGLATETYAQTQATTEAGKVEQKLTGYAKTTDLNGLATETYATNKAVSEAGKVKSELTKYELKTGVDSKVSSMATSLRTETADKMKTVYTKTETETLLGKKADSSTLKNYVQTATYESGIDGVSQSLSRVEGKIDGLQIGGRNYLLNTNEEYINDNSTNYIKLWDITDVEELRGQAVTFSFELKSSSASNGFYVSVSRSIPATVLELTGEETSPTEYKKYEFTFTFPMDTTVSTMMIVSRNYNFPNNTGSTTLRKLKLETGNVATDWTPAPEDTLSQDEYKTFKSDYESTVEGITGQITSLSTSKLDGNTYTNFLSNDYKTTAERATSAFTKVNKVIDANGNSTDAFAKAVYDRNATRQSLAFQDVTKGLVKTATYEDGIDGVKKSITSVQGKLDNLGSPNLLKNSWHNDVDNPAIINTKYNIASWELDKPLVVGKTYTFRMFGLTNRTVFILSTSNGNTPLVDDMTNNADSIIRRETTYNGFSNRSVWERTFTLTQDQADNMTSDTVRVYNMPSSSTSNGEIYWATLVEGSAGIDWSPALSETMGKAEFQVFKGTYENNDQAIKSRLTAIDSGKEGSVIYKTNEALSTAQGNTRTITSLNTKVDGLKIGGRNLISGTDDLTNIFGSGYGGASIKYHKDYKVTDAEWGKATNATRVVITKASGTSGVFTTANDFKMIFGKPYTLSFYVKNLGQNRIQFNLNGLMLNPDGTGGQSIFVNGGESGKFSATGYMRNNPGWNWFQILPVPASGVTSMDFAIAYLQVEEGNFATDWTPALADQMGKAEFTLFKNDYEDTAKKVERRLTAIDSSADDSVVTRLNKTESTASGNSQTIATINKNYVKQSNIDASILADKKIKDTRNTNELPPYYYSKYSQQEVREFKLTSVMGIGAGTYGILTTNVPWSDSSGGRVQQTFDTETEKFTRQGRKGWSSWVKQIDTADTTYQKITETSSLYERILGSKDEAGVKGNISRIVQTSGIIQSEVASAVPNPNLLSGTDFTEGLGDVNEYNRTPTFSEASYFPYGKVATINTPETSGTANLGFSVRIPKKDTWYTLSFYGLTNWVGSSGVSFFSSYMKSSKNYKAPLIEVSPARHRIQVTVQVTQDDAPLCVRPQGNTFGAYSNIVFYGVKLELGEIATPWENSDPATSSKITQLADNINLKVSKGDISNQININSQGVVIKGNKIALSGQTSVNGDFWAKQVNAVKVKADKIEGTTAQFNSLRSNVLTANSITSTMINANTAMFDKLFSTTSATTRLVAEGAWITNGNIISINASKITAGTIAAARLDSKKIVTDGLAANVIKSEHIQGGTALIDKIFADDAYIKRLTGKTAFVSSIQAISINASKITSGVLDASKVTVNNLSASRITSGILDASKVTINNLNVNKLTGNTSSFIQTAWSGLNEFTKIDSTGIHMIGSGTWRRTFISPTGFRMFNGSGAKNKAGAIGYFKSSEDLGGGINNPLKEDFMWQNQQRHTVGIGVNSSHLLSLGFQNPGAKSQDGYNPAITIDPQNYGRITNSTYTEFRAEARFHKSLSFSGKDNFIMYNGLYLNTDYFTIMATTGVRIFRGDQQKVLFGGNMQMHTNIDMNGNTISNQSDERLKKNIETLRSNDFEKLMSVRMISYEWKDPNKQQGTHIGFSAQELQKVYPELILEGEDGYLGIDSNGLAMAHMNAFKQHVSQTNDEISELKARMNVSMNAFKQHDSQTNDEISKLKAQIASLKDELSKLKKD